ncbi:MAG: family 20 glycosylhydrolase [Granulosicoccus sp.]
MQDIGLNSVIAFTGRHNASTIRMVIASMQHQSLFTVLALALSVAFVSACGSSSTADSPGNDTTPDTSTPVIDQPAPTPDNNNDILSHVGKPVPQLTVNPADTALFSVAGRDRAAALPGDIGVIYSVVENHGGDAFPGNGGPTCSSLGAQYNSCSVTNLHIKNSSGSLDDGNWKLYFHSIRRILRVDSEEFSVSHVNGDLNYLEPSEQFTGFDHEVKTIGLVTEFNHLIESDFMPRYWLARDDGSVTLVINTDEETDESRYAAPIADENRRAFNGEPIPLASASTRFEKNQPIQAIADNSPLSAEELQRRIIPKPQTVVPGIGSLDIAGGFSFAGTALSAGNINALQSRQSTFMSTANGTSLSATIDNSLATDSYRLVVDASGITLTGSDRQALFNAAQSLLGLVKVGNGSIPYVSIDDTPRFTFRGMHLDVARNFQSVDSVRKLLDQMAAYKLNKLHLHLSDDEGWRLEIPSLPELTRVGAVRSFQIDGAGRVTEAAGLMPQLGSGPQSDNQGTGFFTAAQFVDLLRYAADREISIIPELDMPAHARAAVVAMRARAVNLGDANDLNIRVDDPADTSRYLTIQHYDDGILNPCVAGTYNFITSVVTDVNAMYAQAGLSLDVWHMGGDEARNVFEGPGFNDADIDRNEWDFPWEQSPACANFIQNTAEVSSRDDLQPYFVNRVAQIVADAGIPAMYAYQDIYNAMNASELSTQRAGVGFWEPISSGTGANNINDFSNRGFETVVAVPDFLYFDFPQEVDPEERGYYWATRSTDTRKVFGFAPENLPQNAETSVNREGREWSATGTGDSQGFIGMQGQLWGETVRTAEQMEYMIFPRLLALAERAWHRAPWELDYQAGRTFSGSSNLVSKDTLNTDYAGFAQALALKELAKLDAAGIRYRISVPGASDQGGMLEMNSDFPGLPLEYSTDGSSFTTFSAGTSAAGIVAIRARSADGARAGRTDTFP